MLDYVAGKTAIQFDTGRYDFRALVLGAMQAFAAERGGEVESLGHVHHAPGIQDNLEPYRQACFALFRTPEFQAVFKRFGAYMIDTYFGGVGLIQKTPTVRIQLPGASSTSYHSDGWYGHGGSVRSFWLPLTDVGPGNTLYMARSTDESQACMADILRRKASLAEINEIAREVCEPFTGGFGDILTFSSAMIHGTEPNSWDRSRFSFDFRIAPDADDLGSKPRSNFYSRAELDGDADQAAAGQGAEAELLHLISYSNNCLGHSSKAQLMLCNAYADANGIKIVGNEAEIVALDYLPVLRSCLADHVNKSEGVIVFSADVFEGDADLATQVLDLADEKGTVLVFSSEGYHYRPGADRGPIMARVSPGA